MSLNHNVMITLTEPELEQLEIMSFTLGCSKSRLIAQALNMMKFELESTKSLPFPDKIGEKPVKYQPESEKRED